MNKKDIWLLKDYEGEVCCAFDDEEEAEIEKACAIITEDEEFNVEKITLYIK